MKIRLIGLNNAPAVEAVLLTPEEYERHPAYHPFYVVTRPTLFVGEAWAGVSREAASGYALIESSPEERLALWEAGYRMTNLENPSR